MPYGAEAVAYSVQRLYQRLSEEVARALHFSFCSPINQQGEAENLIKEKSRQTNTIYYAKLFMEVYS